MSEDASDPMKAAFSHPLLPLRTALDLRAVSESVMGQFADFAVGTPVTGVIDRGVRVRVGSDADVTVDIVRPVSDATAPVLVYIHGGGWVMGDLDLYHQLVRRFAEQGFVVVAVEYRLAPEHPFPAGYDDCVSAVRWAIKNISEYGGDPERIVVAGDSAGANIAAGIAVSEPDLPIRAAALLYGVYDLEHMPTTPEIHAEGFLDDLHRAYLGAQGLHLLRDPRVGPIHAAAKLPPTYVAVGSDDPGLSESNGLVEELRKAGVQHQYAVLRGYPHGFMQIETMPETLPMFSTIASFLKRHAS